MKVLTVLALLIISYTNADGDADDCYRLWPEDWHFLNPNSTDARSGLLLAEYRDRLFTIGFSKNNTVFENICNSEEYYLDTAHWYFNETELDQFPSAYVDADGGVYACESSASLDSIYLKCGAEKPDDDWCFTDAGLYKLDNRTGDVEQGSEGLLLVHFSKSGQDEWLSGLVCDDKFNSHAANLSCQYLGFEYAEDWGSEPRNFQYIPEELVKEAGVGILVDDIQCSEGDREITDCDAKVLDGHDCSLDESLWLKCAKDGGEADWSFHSAALIRLLSIFYA